jgi:protein-tyrosine-phosphatase
MERRRDPIHVLFLCTANSARSQMAEAILQHRQDARLIAGSAGTEPAAQVNPYAVAELNRRGIGWHDRRPKSVQDVMHQSWDIVITVCDHARETCPVIPGRPITAHWGVDDPAAIDGNDAVKQRAFYDAASIISRRIDLLQALPLEKLEALVLQRELQRIGEDVAAKELR